ncbi:MAG: histidine phosphatase family protein [Gammaproteobacteria bacterium]|nr:histidine phosphatase family protein [Gammaproteobacteria bacterium]
MRLIDAVPLPIFLAWLPGLLLLLLAAQVRSFAAPEMFAEVLASAEHIEQLRAGGLVLYLRHGATDVNYPDRIPVDIHDCSTQRPLSAQGREQLGDVAAYWARLDIPLEQVISSPFCRARETAHQVFPDRVVSVDEALLYTAAMPSAEKRPAVERTVYWLSKPLNAGSNRVVVAHGPNIAELMDYLPTEASITLFRPLGVEQGFAYVASIPAWHWPELLMELGLE